MWCKRRQNNGGSHTNHIYRTPSSVLSPLVIIQWAIVKVIVFFTKEGRLKRTQWTYTKCLMVKTKTKKNNKQTNKKHKEHHQKVLLNPCDGKEVLMNEKKAVSYQVESYP